MYIHRRGKNGRNWMLKCQKKYVIIMGGWIGTVGVNDAIYVLNLNTMQFCKCKMRLPFQGSCRAIIMENKGKNDLLIHGFVRMEMNKYKMNVPFALISLIAIWHSIEWVHVVDCRNGDHWKISVDRIVQNEN